MTPASSSFFDPLVDGCSRNAAFPRDLEEWHPCVFDQKSQYLAVDCIQ